MLDVVEGTAPTGLPFGLLLTRIFEWLDFIELDTIVAKEFLDVKSLQQTQLKVEKDGTIVLVEPTNTPTAPVEVTPNVYDPQVMDLL